MTRFGRLSVPALQMATQSILAALVCTSTYAGDFYVRGEQIGQAVVLRAPEEDACLVITPRHVAGALDKLQVFGNWSEPRNAERVGTGDLIVVFSIAGAKRECQSLRRQSFTMTLERTLRIQPTGLLQLRDEFRGHRTVPVNVVRYDSNEIGVQATMGWSIHQGMSGAALVIGEGQLAGVLIRVETDSEGREIGVVRRREDLMDDVARSLKQPRDNQGTLQPCVAAKSLTANVHTEIEVLGDVLTLELVKVAAAFRGDDTVTFAEFILRDYSTGFRNNRILQLEKGDRSRQRWQAINYYVQATKISQNVAEVVVCEGR